MLKRNFLLLAAVLCILSGGNLVFAQDSGIPELWRQNLELKYEYRHFQLNLDRYADQFFSQQTVTASRDENGVAVTGFCPEEADGELPSAAGATQWDVNMEELRRFLREDVAPRIATEVSHVTISRDTDGNIVFDGYGEFGRELNVEISAELIAAAAKNGINKVTLAVTETPPQITVNDPELAEQGIKELLSVGWSDFSGSPANRRHNIDVGRARFNGVLIPQGAEFSFNEHLGPVDASTGYLKELVIVGPTTVPEYGGGLCQVSSTTYRGAMLAGFEVLDRKNHSYNVSYYHPIGSDATIYPGSADLRFVNDTPGAVLIQTRIDGDNLYFHYYGTRDKRRVYTLGPYTWDYVGAPAPRYTTSTNVPVGESQMLSAAHTGLKASWHRLVENEVAPITNENMSTPEAPQIATRWENYYSHYQARGLWVVTGVAAEEVPAVEAAEPEWLGG